MFEVTISRMCPHCWHKTQIHMRTKINVAYIETICDHCGKPIEIGARIAFTLLKKGEEKVAQ